MLKKISILLTIMVIAICFSHFSFASSILKDVSSTVETGVNGATEIVKDTINDAGTMVDDTVNSVSSFSKESIEDITKSATSNYNSEKTSTTSNALMVSSTLWIWISIAVAAIVIIGLIWYYASQDTTRNMN